MHKRKGIQMNKRYTSIEQIKNDFPHFFKKNAMKGFHTIVHPEIYYGCLFITSEKFEIESPRFYNVREVVNGDLHTVGTFMYHSYKRQALKALEEHAQEKGYTK